MPAPSRSNRHSRTDDRTSSATALEILRAPTLATVPWLVHGFSTRQGGASTCYGGPALNLGLTPQDSRDNVEQNRRHFLSALGTTDWPLVQLKQMHSALVHRVSGPPDHPLVGDGLVTDIPGLLLAIKTADCVPILICDVKRRVVGAFHAGWRGTVARIAQKGLGEMRRHFGSLPEDLSVAIGPCIRRCCYAVGPEVRAEFESQFSYAAELFEEVFDSNALHLRYPLLFLNQRAPGHGEPGVEIHLDLVAANRRQLQAAGVRNANISVVEGCTACGTARFFSHRAELGKTGRMMGMIGVRPE